ncbi:unnamed protein product [Caenorhabditis bovis]|uniref:Uncharacterized protein n=1 Tax=Caenorhabditis bovis TaxID=2654633 RepID=A0A8S1F1S0_9PELO|nr:unnamed protein product [Caenorhabditis bovis]
MTEVSFNVLEIHTTDMFVPACPEEAEKIKEAIDNFYGPSTTRIRFLNAIKVHYCSENATTSQGDPNPQPVPRHRRRHCDSDLRERLRSYDALPADRPADEIDVTRVELLTLLELCYRTNGIGGIRAATSTASSYSLDHFRRSQRMSGVTRAIRRISPSFMTEI